MRRAIITGATGFIGRRLSEVLLSHGIEVYGIGRDFKTCKSFESNPLFHPVKSELDEYSILDSIISERGFDTFFHLSHLGVNGSQKSDYHIQIRNTIISCDTILSAKKLGCRRFVFAGSVDEYEACNRPDASFIAPSHSKIYGITKFASESIGKIISLENDIEFVSALLPLTYGEGNKTNILPNTIIRSTEKELPIKLISGNNLFDINYIDETVGGIIAAAEKGQNLESYYVGHHELQTFREIVINICKTIGSRCELRFGEYPDPDYSIDYNLINRKKLFNHTGYKCEISFCQSLLQTKEWLLAQDTLDERGII